MNYFLAPFEKRIAAQLPPMSTTQIENIRHKYNHHYIVVVDIITRKIERYATKHEYWTEVFDDWIYNRDRYKITTIEIFERGLINALMMRMDPKEEIIVNTSILREIIGGRIYRSRIFDALSEKYFSECVKKLYNAGISNPVLVATEAFEECENFHISFDEGEDQFVSELNYHCDMYSDMEQRPKIKIKPNPPFFPFSLDDET